MNTHHVYTVCMSCALSSSSATNVVMGDRNMQRNNVQFLPGTATYGLGSHTATLIDPTGIMYLQY